jgi:chromosome segregation ATPase
MRDMYCKNIHLPNCYGVVKTFDKETPIDNVWILKNYTNNETIEFFIQHGLDLNASSNGTNNIYHEFQAMTLQPTEDVKKMQEDVQKTTTRLEDIQRRIDMLENRRKEIVQKTPTAQTRIDGVQTRIDVLKRREEEVETKLDRQRYMLIERQTELTSILQTNARLEDVFRRHGMLRGGRRSKRHIKKH